MEIMRSLICSGWSVFLRVLLVIVVDLFVGNGDHALDGLLAHFLHDDHVALEVAEFFQRITLRGERAQEGLAVAAELLLDDQLDLIVDEVFGDGADPCS